MFMKAYQKALEVLMKKPITLWGLSLLSGLIVSIASIVCFSIPVAGVVVTYLITCGMSKVFLDGFAGKDVCSDQLFACFNKNFLRIAGGMAWRTLWIIIWALVPIVGPIIAIVKAYSYSFVPYILATKPEVTATQALKLSMQMTNGIKGQMFIADLLFGVAIYVAVLILGLLSAIPILGILFMLVLFVLLIVIAALSGVFQGLYNAYFFVERDGNVI